MIYCALEIEFEVASDSDTIVVEVFIPVRITCCTDSCNALLKIRSPFLTPSGLGITCQSGPWIVEPLYSVCASSYQSRFQVCKAHSCLNIIQLLLNRWDVSTLAICSWIKNSNSSWATVPGLKFFVLEFHRLLSTHHLYCHALFSDSKFTEWAPGFLSTFLFFDANVLPQYLHLASSSSTLSLKCLQILLCLIFEIFLFDTLECESQDKHSLLL